MDGRKGLGVFYKMFPLFKVTSVEGRQEPSARLLFYVTLSADHEGDRPRCNKVIFSGWQPKR